jgi:hypothetical protein
VLLLSSYSDCAIATFFELCGHQGFIRAITFSPDSLALATAIVMARFVFGRQRALANYASLPAVPLVAI